MTVTKHKHFYRILFRGVGVEQKVEGASFQNCQAKNKTKQNKNRKQTKGKNKKQNKKKGILVSKHTLG